MLSRVVCSRWGGFINKNTALRATSVRLYKDVAHKGGYPPGLEPPTLDEMAVPSGSWEESYQRYQRKYNIQLTGGVLFLAATLAYVWSSGVIDLVLAPPMKNPK